MIVVFGAIGWHTIARDDTGTMDVCISGAGYDLATAFASLQVPCRFVTALPTGRIADLYRMDIEELGLESQVHPFENLPFSGSISWQRGNAEQVFRAHPAFEATFPETFITGALVNAEYVVCELGFTDDTLSKVAIAAKQRDIPLMWVVRDPNGWERLVAHPEWQGSGIFVSPSATTGWLTHASAIPGVQEHGAVAMSENGNMLWLLNGDNREALPLAQTTQQPEARFTPVVAAIVNEMQSWQRSLIDATLDCGPSFQDWADPGYSNAADLERKIASFYKKVENLEHDALTGILTRGTAEKLLASRVFDNPLSMIIVDVDHFKRVNDTLGHATGDKVLIQVANHLSREIRTKDVAVRWGGEEFVVFLPGTPEEKAAAIAERIRLSLHNITTELGHITASFGVVEKKDESIDNWVLRADTRLYAAKHGGRDRVVSYDPGDNVFPDKKKGKVNDIFRNE